MRAASAWASSGTSAPPWSTSVGARTSASRLRSWSLLLRRFLAHHPRPGRPAPARLDDGRRVRLVHPGAVVRPEDVGQPAAHALDGVVDPPRRGRRQRVAGPVRRLPAHGGANQDEAVDPGRMVEDQLRGDARPQGVAAQHVRPIDAERVEQGGHIPAMSPNP